MSGEDKKCSSFLEISDEAGPLDLGLHQDKHGGDGHVSEARRRGKKRRGPSNKKIQSKPILCKTEFSSDLLERLNSFLPQIRKANEDLGMKDSKEYNIEEEHESDEGEEEKIIEMNFGLTLNVHSSGSEDEDPSTDNEEN